MANPSRQGRSGRRKSSDLRRKYFGFAQRIADSFFGNPILTAAQTDNFNDNSLDTNKWINLYGAMILEQNQRLEISTLLTPGYYALESKNVASLYDSAVSVKITNAGNQALTTFEFYPISISNQQFSNKVEWLIAGGTCYMFQRIGGVALNLGGSFAYSAVTHLYFRIREQEGFTYFDTSANGSVWTNRRKIVNVMSLSDIKVLMQLGNYGTELSMTNGYWDDYNITATGGSFSQTCTEAIIFVDNIARTPGRRLIESPILVDNIFKIPSRFLIDSTAIVDNIARTVQRFLIDSLVLVDNFTGKITGRMFIEAVAVVDNISRSITRILSEAVTLVDNLVRTITRSFIDAVSFVDTFTGAKVTLKSLIDSLAVVDTVTKSTSRFLIDATAIVDNLRRTTTRTFIDSLAVVDTVTKTSGRFLIDSLTVVDNVIKLTMRRFVEAATIVDNLIRTTTKYLIDYVFIHDGWGKAIRFDGIDDYITAPASIILPSTGFSVQFRYKQLAWAANNRIVDQADSGPTNGFTFVQAFITNSIRTGVYNGASLNSALDSGALNIGQEYLVTSTFDGTRHRLYIDNSMIVEDSNNVMSQSSSPLTIGKRSAGATNYTNFEMDEFRVWYRELTAAEIIEHTTGRYSDDNALKIYYDFDELSGTAILDKSGNNNHGTLFGSAVRIDSFVSKSIQYTTGFFSRIGRTVYETITAVDSIFKTTSRVIQESIAMVDTFISQVVTLVIRSIGNWILYSLLGRERVLQSEQNTHVLSTSVTTHVVLLSERSFTLSAPATNNILQPNTTP